MKYCRTYWNPTTQQYGYVERKNLHGRFEFYAIHDMEVHPYPSFGAAYDELKKAGYEPMGFLDDGARRYTMTVPELENLYKRLENFIADCTRLEYERNREHINAVFSLLHEHMNTKPII